VHVVSQLRVSMTQSAEPSIFIRAMTCSSATSSMGHRRDERYRSRKGSERAIPSLEKARTRSPAASTGRLRVPPCWNRNRDSSLRQPHTTGLPSSTSRTIELALHLVPHVARDGQPVRLVGYTTSPVGTPKCFRARWNS